MNLPKWIEAIKLPPKYLFPIVIFTGSILFSKENFLNYLGIQEFVNQYRAWFGFAFLASSVLLISHGAIKIGGFVMDKIRQRQITKIGQRLLHKLTHLLKLKFSPIISLTIPKPNRLMSVTVLP